MRILLLNPNQISRYNWGHQLFKNEFGKQHKVVYYGQGFPGFNPGLTVPQILKQLNKPFDIILTYEIKYGRFFKGLGEITNIPKVHIQIDYKTHSEVSIPKEFQGFSFHTNLDKYFHQNKYDLVFTFITTILKDLKANLKTEKVYLLPFCADTNRYKNLGLKKDIDVMAVFTARPLFFYPTRAKIQKLVQKMGIKSFTKKVVRHEYIKMINRSKIFAHGNGLWESLSMKYSEVMACGTFFLTDKPREPADFEEQGFVDGKHLVLYEGLKDLENKIRYYLEHAEEREQIARQGMEFVREKHSCAARVRQFTEIVQREFNIS
jgi:spore maturation protein CgeB